MQWHLQISGFALCYPREFPAFGDQIIPVFLVHLGFGSLPHQVSQRKRSLRLSDLMSSGWSFTTPTDWDLHIEDTAGPREARELSDLVRPWCCSRMRVRFLLRLGRFTDRGKAGSTSKTGRDLFIGVCPFLVDRRKRQSGSLRPVPAFRNAELSSPQEEASDLTAGTAAGADDELRQPVRVHAQTRREQMRRRSQFVRTAPPASTRHVQPSDVCFRLAALPNFCSFDVDP